MVEHIKTILLALVVGKLITWVKVNLGSSRRVGKTHSLPYNHEIAVHAPSCTLAHRSSKMSHSFLCSGNFSLLAIPAENIIIEEKQYYSSELYASSSSSGNWTRISPSHGNQSCYSMRSAYILVNWNKIILSLLLALFVVAHGRDAGT